MAEESKSSLRFIITILIAFLAATGGIGGFVAWYNTYKATTVCSVSGTVYDEYGRPAQQVLIDYKDANLENSYKRLAQTAPDGHFDANCSDVAKDYPFPEIRAGVMMWISTQARYCSNFEHTKVFMKKGREEKNVNIYVHLNSDYIRCVQHSEIND